MHFFVVKLLSISVMTYTCIHHVRGSLSDDPANLLRTLHTANKLQHATAARALTRDLTAV